MGSAEQVVAPLDFERLTEEMELRHLACCDDSDLLLCGLDGSSMAWDLVSEPTCASCAMNARDDICPKHGVCPQG